MSSSASMIGHGYQAMVFWKYANQMLREGSEIEAIGYEYKDIKSFDDIVVMYKGEKSFKDCFIERDYIQVKYHIAQTHYITLDDLMDPRFVNASKYSFMDKVVLAYREKTEDFSKYRFILYTPWNVQQKDPLDKLLDNEYGAFRLEKLFNGTTNNSAMGRIRKKFRDKLKLDDDELRIVLKQVCIWSGSERVYKLEEELNTGFYYNKLKVCSNGVISNQYISMIHRWKKDILTAADIMEQCKREGLIATEKKEELITIRSFPSLIEERAAALLDFVPYFDGRYLKDEADCSWRDLGNKIVGFVKDKNNIQPEKKYYIDLATHFTIAFMAGRIMDSRRGIYCMPVQRTQFGKCNWDIDNRNENPMHPFQMTTIDMNRAEEKSDAGNDIKNVALVVSATHSILKDVESYIEKNDLKMDKIIHFQMPETGLDSVKSGSHAWQLATQISKKIGEERDAALHIFCACPVAIMFNLGKMSSTYRDIQLYERDEQRQTYYASTRFFPLIGQEWF